ncbi:uncharacterized protein PG998_003173 [Apiospora kogelbergensis]|uniref:uncharacterized protein n=1 Tax=Apiospora kogelbergensis TaxID=1337665 RepID=UPI0031323D55
MKHHQSTTLHRVAAAMLALSSAQTAAAAAVGARTNSGNDVINAAFAQVQSRVIECPKVHVFGARETLQPQGFGTAKSVVDSVLRAHNGSVTAEDIIYPAAGGDNAAYAASAKAGVEAVVRQTKSFADMCPQAKIVMVGYSQGAQIMDDALCGGSSAAGGNTQAPRVADMLDSRIAAVIMMGNPRHADGLSYNVGTAEASGFAARPQGFECPDFAARIQSYCDADDPFCAKGNDTAAHQEYGQRYGQEALAFVQKKLAEMPTPQAIEEEEPVSDKLIVAGKDKESVASALTAGLSLVALAMMLCA